MPTAEVTVVGLPELRKQLLRMPKTIRRPVEQSVVKGAMLVHGEAVVALHGGPATGRTYEKYKPRRTHKASAPGEAPQSDTGGLASSVRWKLASNGLEATVGTDLDYGSYLEFGAATANSGARQLVGKVARINIQSILQPRPWLMPAMEKSKPLIITMMVAAIRAAFRKMDKRPKNRSKKRG